MQPVFPILVGTDFSDGVHLPLERGLDGVRRDANARLHVVAVIDDSGRHLLPAEERHSTLMQMMDRVRDLLGAEVAAAIQRFGQATGETLQIDPFIHVRLGGVAEQIAALATEIRAELVIVGTHGKRGSAHHLGASIAERTVRLAPCPVLVVRPTDFHAMDGLPAIEPACPACLKERELTAGAHWWCAEHSIEREPAHTYSSSNRLSEPQAPRNHML